LTSIPLVIVFVCSGTSAWRLRRRTPRCGFVWFGLFEGGAFLFQLSAAREVLLSIEENFAID
jgi:hypothetical protein